MDMEMGEVRMEEDMGNGSGDKEFNDEVMDDLEETGRGMELKEKSRELGKHRSKDRKKGRREEDNVSRDGERSKDRDLDRHDTRVRDRLDSRERKKEDKSEYARDREHEKDHDRDKERSREKLRDKDYDRGKPREKERDTEYGKDRGKERDRDKEVDRDRERSYDRERERGRDRGKNRDKEYVKDREIDRLNEVVQEAERGKERDRMLDHGRDREKEHDRERDGDKGQDRRKTRERDHEKEMVREFERERGREKDRDKGRDREREREKDRDRLKEKEKIKDREKEKERDRLERDKNKDKAREKEGDHDKSRARDRDSNTDRSKDGEKDEKLKIVGKKEAQSELDSHEKIDSKDHDEKSAALNETTSELAERLIKLKEYRLKRKADGASEILSWVDKSRKLEDKRYTEKEKVQRHSKVLDEQDEILGDSDDEDGHSRNDLAGVKILHGLDKVMEGGAVVLTLKDQNILVDGDINEEIDMLENVEIGEQKQRDEAYKAAKKKPGIYEDKFSEDLGSRRTILPQYDDPIVDEGVTLDESGRFAGEAEKKLEELRMRIAGASANKSYEDLTKSEKILSDYYTTDEMLQFKKPKKKKSLRKKDKLDLDALEAEAKSAGLGAEDLGSRKDSKRRSAKDEQEKNEAEMRSSAYQSAYAKAEEASKVLRQDQTLTITNAEDDELVFGEDYEDLQKSLDQARKLARQRKDEIATSGPQAVALLAGANMEKGDTQSSPAEDPQDNKVVITEMEEFVLGLQFDEETHRPDTEDVFKDEDDGPEAFTMDTKDDSGVWTEVKEAVEDEVPINEEKDDISPDEIIHEPSIGKGLSGALKLLKDRGTLKEDIDWGGRNMDKKKSKLVGINENDGPKEIRIERTDEFGRIMTPKEAFRLISHKFHGKGPGKMKQEKRMKQYQESLKTKQMKASDTPSLAMERMRETQARLKTPYVVLSGHVKPGQTSDPRSGFATVEKDHLGSLTPMLGDKKVEHFLGINRKPDAGSMGPPPAKRPKT